MSHAPGALVSQMLTGIEIRFRWCYGSWHWPTPLRRTRSNSSTSNTSGSQNTNSELTTAFTLQKVPATPPWRNEQHLQALHCSAQSTGPHTAPLCSVWLKKKTNKLGHTENTWECSPWGRYKGQALRAGTACTTCCLVLCPIERPAAAISTKVRTVCRALCCAALSSGGIPWMAHCGPKWRETRLMCRERRKSSQMAELLREPAANGTASNERCWAGTACYLNINT